MENPKITVIGAVNMDVIGFPKKKLIHKDDVPGFLKTSIGGVGRNISMNLSKLDFDVAFLTVLAKDNFGKQIKKSLATQQISTAHSLVIDNANTSTFLAIMNEDKDMEYGIAAMDIYKKIPNSFITDNLEVITSSKYCILETNMPKSILELVVKEAPITLFFLDAVSGTKALKAKNILANLQVLKCNRIEAELLSGMLWKDTDYKQIVTYFLNKGVKNIFITLGEKGVIYGSALGVFQHKPTLIQVTNTSGGGDAFMAGLVLAAANNFTIHQMVEVAIACAELTIQHKETVHPKINRELILKKIHA